MEWINFLKSKSTFRIKSRFCKVQLYQKWHDGAGSIHCWKSLCATAFLGHILIQFLLNSFHSDQRLMYSLRVCKNTWFLLLPVFINPVEDCNVEWTRKYLHNRWSPILSDPFVSIIFCKKLVRCDSQNSWIYRLISG